MIVISYFSGMIIFFNVVIGGLYHAFVDWNKVETLLILVEPKKTFRLIFFFSSNSQYFKIRYLLFFVFKLYIVQIAELTRDNYGLGPTKFSFINMPLELKKISYQAAQKAYQIIAQAH